MKQTLKTLCTVALIMSATAAMAASPLLAKPKKATQAIVDGINYKLDAKNNKAKVVAGVNLYAGFVDIPEKFEEDSVTYYVEEIDGGAFKDCVTLSAINIPTTVTKIGAEAFKGCTTLEEITIPNSVLELKSATFEGCSSLRNVVMHNGMTALGSGLFRRCTALKVVNIPDGIKQLPSDLFEGCTSLTAVAIPSTVSKIGSSAFKDCASLTSIELPNTVKDLGSDLSGTAHRFRSSVSPPASAPFPQDALKSAQVSRTSASAIASPKSRTMPSRTVLASIVSTYRTPFAR